MLQPRLSSPRLSVHRRSCRMLAMYFLSRASRIRAINSSLLGATTPSTKWRGRETLSILKIDEEASSRTIRDKARKRGLGGNPLCGSGTRALARITWKKGFLNLACGESNERRGRRPEERRLSRRPIDAVKRKYRQLNPLSVNLLGEEGQSVPEIRFSALPPTPDQPCSSC